jgi:hypothetical protein
MGDCWLGEEQSLNPSAALYEVLFFAPLAPFRGQPAFTVCGDGLLSDIRSRLPSQSINRDACSFVRSAVIKSKSGP